MDMNEPAGADLFPYKKPGLVFADAVRGCSEDERTIVTEYHYTDEYPFIRGHFPGNPVMMGITQVIMGADAAELLAGRLGIEQEQVSADCSIFKGDGSIVCEIKGLGLNMQGSKQYPEFTGVKSVSFRDLVTPDEVLYCKASIK
jgi:3-hydroxymyristoyl/3-hydroxydecanoyl-(acyl carrier protein) dehydratase